MTDPAEHSDPTKHTDPAARAGSADDEVVDAEIVESTAVTPTPTGPAVPDPVVGDYTDRGVPTFDYVRDKIEGRQATTAAAAELTGDPEGVQQRFEEREQAGRDKLEEIRRQLRGE